MYRLASVAHDRAMVLSTAYAWQRHEHFVAEESATREALRPTIYMDTSIPSYLTARLRRDLLTARRQRLTHVWWNRYRAHYTLCISDRVLAEAEAGDSAAAQARLATLDGIATLKHNIQTLRLSEKLIGGRGLPQKASADAEHIAIAAANSVHVLLTWNCKHLANDEIRSAVVQA